jgi:hypothetical protein
MSEENKYKYTYPVDELDKIIEEMMSGIQPMIDDVMQMEVELRWKERQNELFGLDDEEEVDLDPEIVARHNEIMKKNIENDRRKASRNDVIILDIPQEKKDEIRRQMSTSIVRPNPHDPYNKNDDNKFQNEERRKIFERLKGLKNCYYNQTDYVNAISIIRDAIDISLGKYGDGDYPWLTYEEAVKLFNAGKIKFTFCQIPKLYVNHSTQITDKEILKGVVTGDIILKNKNDDEPKRKINRKYKPVAMDYEITGDAMYHEMVQAHRMGYDTPMSTVIRYKNSVYNPSAMPTGNRFATPAQRNNQMQIEEFDWTKEGAGEEYYNLTRGKRQTASDVIRFIDQENNGELNNVLAKNAQNFLNSMKSTYNVSGGYDYTLPNYMQQPNQNTTMPQFNEDAAQLERDLLASITMNNPNIK